MGHLPACGASWAHTTCPLLIYGDLFPQLLALQPSVRPLVLPYSRLISSASFIPRFWDNTSANASRLRLMPLLEMYSLD